MDSRLAKVQRYLIAALVFFVVLAIFPFTPDPAGDVKILGYELGAFAALALWLFSPRDSKEVFGPSSALFPLFFVFLCVTLTTSFFSLNVGYSLGREFAKMAALFFLFVVAAHTFRTPKQVWGLIGAICVAVSIASMYGFLQVVEMDPFPWEDPGAKRLRGAPATFGNRNLASHTLTLVTILAGGLSTQRKGRWALLCIPLFLCHFAFTQTRGSLLALASAAMLVLVTLFFSRTVKKPSRVIALTLGTVLLAGMIGIAVVGTIAKMNTGQPYPDDKSLTYRYNSFDTACRMIQDRPWLGHGPGMYPVVSPEYWTPFEKETFVRRNLMATHAHNEPLEIAAETGLPAAIIFIAILVLGVYYGLSLGLGSADSERRPLGMALAAFFMAFLVDGLFGFNVHAPVSAVLFFLVAGATAGVWRERPVLSRQHTFHYRRFPLLWRFVAVGCALIIPILGIRDFSAKFYQQRGKGALEYKDYTAAAESFHKAASLAPYDWLHHYYLGGTAIRMDSPVEAANHFARSLELNPNFVEALFAIAQAKFNIATSSPREQGQASLKEAISYARRAAQINPLFPDVHDLLGRASLVRATWLADASHGETPEVAEKAWREAEHHLMRAIEYGSEREYMVYRLIAVARMAMEDVLGAQKALIHSLEAKSEEMETWQLFLQSSHKTGRYDAIMASLDWHIEGLTGSQSASDELCRLYLLRAKVLYAGYNDESGAEDAFLLTVEKYPVRVDAWAEFYTFAKSVDRKKVFNTSLNKTLQDMQAEEEHVPVVLEALSVLEGTQPRTSGILNAVAILARRGIEELQEGKDSLEDSQIQWAAELLADEIEASDLLAADKASSLYVLTGPFTVSGRWQVADALFEKAWEDLPDGLRQNAAIQWARAIRGKSQYDRAIELLKSVLSSYPADVPLSLELARTLAEGGYTDRAKLEYEGILAHASLNERQRDTISVELSALSAP